MKHNLGFCDFCGKPVDNIKKIEFSCQNRIKHLEYFYLCHEHFYDMLELAKNKGKYYTGRQDKFGQEILENDILKISGNSNLFGVVVYHNYSASYWVENDNLEYCVELGSLKSNFIEKIRPSKTIYSELFKKK